MSNNKTISEYGIAFAEKIAATSQATLDAKRTHEEAAIFHVYQLLKMQYPELDFDRDRIELENHWWDGYLVATHRSLEQGTFSVYKDGTVWSADSDYCRELSEALYKVEGTNTVGLVTERDGRKCHVRTYSKLSGFSLDAYVWGILRLTHEDTYGQEYVVLDGEKCYLEPLHGRKELENAG